MAFYKKGLRKKACIRQGGPIFRKPKNLSPLFDINIIAELMQV
jgi:hypothetical protein